MTPEEEERGRRLQLACVKKNKKQHERYCQTAEEERKLKIAEEERKLKGDADCNLHVLKRTKSSASTIARQLRRRGN